MRMLPSNTVWPVCSHRHATSRTCPFNGNTGVQGRGMERGSEDTPPRSLIIFPKLRSLAESSCPIAESSCPNDRFARNKKHVNLKDASCFLHVALVYALANYRAQDLHRFCEDHSFGLRLVPVNVVPVAPDRNKAQLGFEAPPAGASDEGSVLTPEDLKRFRDSFERLYLRD